jgi:hypothetical protein
MEKKSTYWNEQREYFKEKTLAFKELKKRRELEIMKKELGIKLKKLETNINN